MASGFDTSRTLIGTDEATLDDKGRLSFTVKKVQRLGEKPLMVLGRADYLVLYPEEVWRSLVAEVLSLPVMDPAREEFSRLILGTASDALSFDQQNRLVVPADLREAAKMDGGTKVKIVGCGDRIEIWKVEKWEQHQQAADDPSRAAAVQSLYQPIAQHVLDTGRDEREAQAKEMRA